MTQHPDHSPQSHHTFDSQEKSLERLREFFLLYPYSTARGNKSSEIFLMQWDLSTIFDYVSVHHVLPLFDTDEDHDDK